MSKSSKTSIRSFRKYGLRKKTKNLQDLLKPYNFCCDINNRDEETRYDTRNLPFSSSLMVISPIQESPTLKFRYQFTEPAINARRKSKSKPEEWNLSENLGSKTRGPLLWYQEDEIAVAKNQFWSEKQKLYNEEADRNALIGEEKVNAKMGSMKITTGPRWYQDLSIPQMKQVLALEATMTADYEETITVRTQKALAIIGVTSTYCKIDPPVIKKLQRRTQLKPVQFLREIYKRVTGQYFEEEEYKETYDCNERIILSAIAFLALPDAVLELNNRLPPISESVFPPKPIPPQTPPRGNNVYKSPYMEPLSLPPNWVMYRKRLDKWRAKCKLVPRPRIILPQLEKYKPNDRLDFGNKTYSQVNFEDVINSQEEQVPGNGANLTKASTEANFKGVKTPFDFSTPIFAKNDKQTFDFTFSGLGDESKPVNYEICGILKPPFPKRKSWLGEKEAHYIISGISEHENPPTCPVTYVMTGISHVTPNNSDEQFFAELKLGDGPKRVYPAGRKNLSKNWQEWLQDADEQFLEVEKEANKIIQSVEATMRLVIPKGRCDACCSCRQTRKTDLKSRATKTPYMVINSIAEGDNQNRYIVGSLAMHSPAPSPTESTVNLLEVIASKEMVQKKLLINGITSDSGETTYYISGITQETQHIPRKTITTEHPPKPLRNVPPCACTIEQMFNEGKTPSGSGDDIPHTKKEGVCCGHKYRPNEVPAITCKKYPDDRSCRRNPFDNKLTRAMLSRTETLCCDEVDGSSKNKMFTLPDFAPCGDEDGMAICGGPWGAKNIPDPKVVAAREAEAKQILKAPPCGDTPGKSVCGGPWGTRIPSPKVHKSGDDEEEDEEDEDEESEKDEQLSPREQAKLAKEAAAKAEKLRREGLKRDNLCSARFEDELGDKADGTRSMVKKAPPVDCDFDNQWNKTRTAPTGNPWNNEYEKSLKLTQAIIESSDGHKINTRSDKEGVSSLKRKQRMEGNTESNRSGKNQSPKEDTNNIRSDIKGHGVKNVEVIYSGKQATKGQPPLINSNVVINGQQSNTKSRVLASEGVRTNSPTSNKNRTDSSKDGRTTRKAQNLKHSIVSSTDKKSQPTKGFVNTKKVRDVDKWKRKRAQSSEKSTDSRSKQLMKNDCGNERDKKRLETSTKVQKSPPKKSLRHERGATSKKHKTKITPGSSSSAPQAQVASRVGKKPNEYNVAPAIIPDEPRILCQRQDTQSDSESDNCGCSGEEQTSMNNETLKEKEGPFGWRTKSQQALPREKTLVYLAEPPDQVDMVKVREGGRPCKCRENRNKKKILIYNIGGTVNVSKGGRRNDLPQVIEGVTYITPPQSPRNSSEYIPEYELFESPYKMCERKRFDQDLKYIDAISTSRGLSPNKETNTESCACRDEHEDCTVENLPEKKTEQCKDDSKAKKRSSALKDEGLIDYFTSCQDAVPCWLKCAKFSKAGCCAKPKLLQVKKPVCECRYERRVVRREEEKQKWFDRQQRLRGAKKQPYMQVAGTSRPMGHDRKLIISSVKKVLRDGEFIPESQYSVSGVAENYAMGPPQHIVPGITMQSPLVTPEPSKPDILCMCGHRHWSPTDITARNLAPEDFAARTNGDYPCRGREQRKEIPNDIIESMEESLSIDDREPYVNYHSCADGSRGRSSIAENAGQSHEIKKRKLQINIAENEVRNANRHAKKAKLNATKIPQSMTEQVKTENSQISTSKNTSKMKKAITARIEEFENAKKQKYHSQKIALFTNTTLESNTDPTYGNSELDKSTSETRRDLYELMKDELQKMASEDFILAKLPECWLIPQLRSWIEYREGKVITNRMKNELCDNSRRRWGMMQQTKKPSIPLPSLQLTPFEIATMTFDRAIEMKEKISVIRRKYQSELRKMRVLEARSYWPTMEFGKFPSLSFKEAYFTYMAGKEADGHVFRPWKLEDSKNH